MSSVRIAELKAHLSEHLRSVRRGETVTVLDRDRPIARLVPYVSEGEALVVHRPSPDSPGLHCVPLPAPLSLAVDSLDFLLEERQVTPPATDRRAR
ncbi:MAG TPA: type II toxin-antitoxin system prevent-host-death family antitoxin [Thermoanaerobaculia bacterium]